MVVLRLVDQLYNELRFEAQAQHFLDQIGKTQRSAPFGDGQGLVASTMDQGDALPPYQQCVSTPFQCIPERVGLAATAWAAFADLNVNPFDPITAPNRPTAQSVGDSATYQPVLSPGSLFSIFGTNLASGEQTAGSAPLLTTLGATMVTINGTPAPLLYVGPKQINGQVPYEVGIGAAVVQAVVNGVAATPLSVSVSATAPRLFTDPANVCIAQNEDGSLNSASNPVKAGRYVVGYLIGLGAVTPPVPTGNAAPATPFSIPSGARSTVVGTRTIAPAYLGLTPFSVGLRQANVLVPSDFGTGLQPFSVTVGNGTSNTCLVAIGDQPITPSKPVISGLHCCPAKSRIDSTGCRDRANRVGSPMLEEPVKWAPFQRA